MTTAEIEKRLTAIERQLAQISQEIGAPATSRDMNGWMDRIHGTFKNDATYREAARLGRQWRRSQGAPRARKSASR